jgi:hypothetical protein
MSSNQPDREQDLKQREESLRQREIEIRLRELAAEVDAATDAQQQPNIQQQPPLYRTEKHHPEKHRRGNWMTRLGFGAKFFGIVVAVIVAVKVASWLATLLLFGGVVWVLVQVFKIGQRRS